MKRLYITFVLLCAAFLLSHCGYFASDKDEKPLARVDDEYLYLSDISDIFRNYSSEQDSIALLNNYINTWIQNKLILKTAEKNLTDEQMNFEKQLAEYRNSLIIYAYESELIKQNLNTEITEQAIEKYYTDNQDNFLLKDNIVRVIYVKTPLKTTNLSKIKSLYKSEDEEDLLRLRDLCEREAINYFIDDVWLVFNDLLKEIPIKTYNQEQFLKTNKYVEMQDSLFNYFLNVRSFKIKESVSPLSMERENIKNILINTQKVELVKKAHEDIYQDAKQKNKFEIYP